MTINLADNSPRISYAVAEGVTQTSFTVPFEFFQDADLNVYVDNTLKTLTTDYTVTGGDGSTGSITISVTGASGGSTVVITRNIDLERTTDFPSSGPFDVASLNTELDKVIAIAADLEDEVNRSLRLTDYDSAVSLVLPDVDTRKGKVLAFNGTTGAVESGPSVSDTQSVADASADIALLADIQDGTIATNAITDVASNITDVQNASANAASALASKNAAATSEANAATSESNAATSESNAATSAATATTKAAEASTSAANASTSETNAASSASSASTSASSASSSASAAASSASSAASAQTAAESARDATLAAYDNFDDRYLGVKASDPTVDNDGDALVAGSLYFNSTDGSMKLYNGSSWVAAYVSGADYLALSGGTMTGDVTYGDGVKAKFGNGPDLEILHDGSNSYINEVGVGSLYLDTANGANVNITAGAGAESMATFAANGAVNLYYDNAKKFETTSYGIDISGSVVADTQTAGSITGATTLDFATYQNFVLTLTGNTTLSNPTTEKVGQSGFISITQTGGYTLSLGTDYETAGGAGITLSASGTDLIPYLVIASGRILLGTPQLAFA